MFLIYNFTVTLFFIGLLVSIITVLRSSQPVDKKAVVHQLLRWFVLCSIGISYLMNTVFHTVLAEQTAEFIGWANSPFQLEVGFASLGFSLVGFIAFNGNWLCKVCAIVGPSCFLLGAAGGHIYQMVVHDNFAPGNAGSVFYTDLLLPLFGLSLLYLSKRWEHTSAPVNIVRV